MNKIIWILVLSLIPSFSLLAQEGGRLSYEQYPSFKGDTLLILTGKDEAYDKVMASTIQSSWKATPYRFVNEKELYKLANSEAYSMLVLDKTTKTRGRSTIRRKHLSIFPCGRSADLTNYGGKYAVSQFSLYDVENSSSFIGKLPFLVNSMQSYLTFLDTAKSLMEDTYETTLLNWKSSQVSSLKNHILVIPSDNLPKGTSAADLKSVYPFPYKVVKSSEIGKFQQMEKGSKALFHMDARKRYITIILEDGQVLYTMEASSPGDFSSKDLKAIAKAIEKPAAENTSLKSRFDRFNRKLNKSIDDKNKKSGKN
ncbi:MAG: hypothetical protein MRZ79_21805 [Bacteroidia bacterium]|nr:hypothetical protein [Bacteroidia bacterium]